MRVDDGRVSILEKEETTNGPSQYHFNVTTLTLTLTTLTTLTLTLITLTPYPNQPSYHARNSKDTINEPIHDVLELRFEARGGAIFVAKGHFFLLCQIDLAPCTG